MRNISLPIILKKKYDPIKLTPVVKPIDNGQLTKISQSTEIPQPVEIFITL
jgi:hypothetical protein